MGAIKQWQFHDDFVLSNLCKMIINRHLLKIEINDDKINKDKYLTIKNKFIDKMGITEKK